MAEGNPGHYVPALYPMAESHADPTTPDLPSSIQWPDKYFHTPMTLAEIKYERYQHQGARKGQGKYPPSCGSRIPHSPNLTLGSPREASSTPVGNTNRVQPRAQSEPDNPVDQNGITTAQKIKLSLEP